MLPVCPLNFDCRYHNVFDPVCAIQVRTFCQIVLRSICNFDFLTFLFQFYLLDLENAQHRCVLGHLVRVSSFGFQVYGLRFMVCNYHEDVLHLVAALLLKCVEGSFGGT